MNSIIISQEKITIAFIKKGDSFLPSHVSEIKKGDTFYLVSEGSPTNHYLAASDAKKNNIGDCEINANPITSSTTTKP